MNGRNLSRILAAILSFGGVGSFASASASEDKTNKVEISSVEVVESSVVKNGEVDSKKCLARVRRMVDRNGKIGYIECEFDDPEEVEELFRQFRGLWGSSDFGEMILSDLDVEDLLNYFCGNYAGNVIFEEVEGGKKDVEVEGSNDVAPAPSVADGSAPASEEVKNDNKGVKVDEQKDVTPAPSVADNSAPAGEEVKSDKKDVKVEGSNNVAPTPVENVTPEIKVVESNVVGNSTSKGENDEKKVDVEKPEVSGEVKA